MGKRILAVAVLAGIVVFHPIVHALAMAEIQLNSSLNQPLNAIIDLTARADELDGLNIAVTRLNAESTGLQHWPGIKAKLVREEGGRSYINVTSDDVIREPIISFLLELSWSQGRIQREYSLLIDPQQ